MTASLISFANSTSVIEKLSGEYCSITSVPFSRGRRSLIHCRPADGDVDDLVLAESEDDAALRGRGRVVEMNDRALRTDERFDGAFDEVFARLHEHLHGHVVGNAPVFDERAVEGELGIRGGGKADLDFLEAAAHQRLKQLELLRDVHGHRERLIAVAQIDAAPDGRARQGASGPLPLG
jgi:hypothetical protein